MTNSAGDGGGNGSVALLGVRRRRSLIAAVEMAESIQRGIDDLVGFLPRFIGFLLILLIGYLVAKAFGKVVALALEKVGTDQALASGSTGTYVERVLPDASPSKLIGGSCSGSSSWAPSRSRSRRSASTR